MEKYGQDYDIVHGAFREAEEERESAGFAAEGVCEGVGWAAGREGW